MKNISLNSIKTFVVAAHYLSFKKAAEQLHVTPGAVSRQIRSLEQQLAAPLFRRQHREVQLTQAGVDYLKWVKPALAEIDSANQLLINRSKQRNLKIQTSPTFALHWLIPRLASFKQQYPEIQIEIATSSYSIDPDPAFNLYIRRDPAQFSGLKSRPFMIEYCYLVCARSILQGSRNLLQLMQTAPLITYKTRPGLWQHWFDEAGLSCPQKEQDISFENTIFAIQAAVEGLGVALIPQVFLTDLLHSNALVLPFSMQPIATGHYHVLTQSEQLNPTEQLFLDWLQREGLNE
ncbi:MAG: LysR substrate-binding domain-containing protein [Pseudomonadales bacterium]|nr:LysR substrate-binding domain-containing protein [Pseudomonadales bacterium]NRA15933.1 LysR family transcriptional regulator [Oceanospirillaceae bacterium]